jgi:hypothetical protein
VQTKLLEAELLKINALEMECLDDKVDDVSDVE